MRSLTEKQKRLLKKWRKEAKPTEKEKLIFGKINPLNKWMDLSLKQMEELEEINDTEILPQEVDYFLNELNFNN